MKIIKALFCCSLIVFSSSLSAQSWLWGAAGYCSIKTSSTCNSVATDKSGNAYITGQYYTTIIFGSDTLKGGWYNPFLVKYNSFGSVLWARQPIDSNNAYSYGTSVATDKSGSVLITGRFKGIVRFGSIILKTNDNYSYDLFLVKYDAGGNVIWAKQSKVPSNYSSCDGDGVATDESNNIFVTGYFSDTVSFGTYTLKNIYGNATVFLTKYDSLGNVLWAKQSDMPSSGCSAISNSVTCDKSGNAYLTGYFYTAIFFGSYTLISLNYPSAFLVKYSATGNVSWAKQSVNTNSILSNGYGSSVTTDKENNSYLTGYFEDSLQFGSHYLYSPSIYSVFFTKYDSSGNVLWAKQSSQGWQGTILTSDAMNHVYLAGKNSFGDSTIMFGSFKLHAVPWASVNSFIIEFDTSGNPICGSVLENVGNNGVGITTDSSGNYTYMASTFLNDSVKCGPDILYSNTGGTNIFVGRWITCGDTIVETSINPISNKTEINVFPNPSTGIFIIQSSVVSCQSSVEVYNVLGEKVYSSSHSLSTNHYSFDLSNQPNGIYLYRVLNEDGSLLGEGKVIVQK